MCGTNCFFFFQKVIVSLYKLCLHALVFALRGKLFNSVCKTELIRVIKLGLFLKQGGKVNYFCLKHIQQGLKAFAAHLYPHFP